jgi:hypothetical protein
MVLLCDGGDASRVSLTVASDSFVNKSIQKEGQELAESPQIAGGLTATVAIMACALKKEEQEANLLEEAAE